MHIFIATPCYNSSVTAAYADATTAFVLDVTRRGGKVTRTFRMTTLLAQSRSEFVTDFLNTAATHLLFWDADTAVAPEVLFEMKAFDKPIVGAVYPHKSYDFSKFPAAREPSPKPPREIFSFVLPIGNNYGPIWKTTQRIGPFAKVPRVGTGLMLIQRKALETMIAAWPETRYRDRRREHHALFEPMIHPVSRQYISEDFSFCDRWTTRCNGEIWCHVEAEVTHLGIHPFTASYSDPLPPSPSPASPHIPDSSPDRP